MSVVLILLIVACVVSIFAGLVKPEAVIRWGKPEKRGRGKVILYYGLALIVLFFVIGSTAEETDSVQQAASKAETNLTSTG